MLLMFKFGIYRPPSFIPSPEISFFAQDQGAGNRPDGTCLKYDPDGLSGEYCCGVDLCCEESNCEGCISGECVSQLEFVGNGGSCIWECQCACDDPSGANCCYCFSQGTPGICTGTCQ